MLARECILFSGALVGDGEIEKIIQKSDAGEELTTAEEKKLKKYISGLNIAVDTIASKNYYSVRSASVTSDENQKIDYSALSGRVYEIVEVRDSLGFRVDFYSLPFSLYLPQANTQYWVKYKFLPEKVSGLDSEVAVLPIISEKIVGFLMASDYLLSLGLYDESKFWYAKYEDEFNRISFSKRGKCFLTKNLL